MIAARIPMVKHTTINKALPGDKLDYHLFSYFNKKQEHFVGYSFPSGILGR